ncbi:MAG: 4Fe-4S dicluster domain-containing protein [Pseudobutyrivibrio ruminis]|uniref:4Fe-4S dicluster domain-containing protein n=1 Tax=Pseudobutyrivibrio ruminis TaxID=46206 RepID=A0A927UA05_9FIRM|nr:4Fe-4S dicluster domain-containing protein [Pseudobutyrivibrio ruminis]
MLFEEKEKCCGCTACYNACPVGAIEMKPDFEGFLYPEINSDKCINCGACERVCPIKQYSEPETGFLKTFTLRTKEDAVLSNSTSGGFTTPLVEYVINNGGVVCCASYTSDFEVKHVIIDSPAKLQDEINKMRGSKYVQSNLSDVYKKIKEYVLNGRIVCFIGTTCQVTGLSTYLGKKYDNLYLVDVVCHGTPSPKLFKKYLDYQRNKYNSDIKNIVFRNKTYGYHSGTMKMEFENGKVYYGSARVDYMLKSFFKEISSRPSCYECKFKTKKRYSDYTIYDAWHASEIAGINDDDKGFTHVIVHSEKGINLLRTICDKYEMYEVDGDLAVELDGVMVTRSAVPHPRRKEYYENLSNSDLDSHINSFIPVTKKDYFLENTKTFFYKCGLMDTMRKLKKA